MPATAPRVNVAFKQSTIEVLKKISVQEHESLSHVVAQLVEHALALAEDLALGRIAEQRLASFRRDDALTSKDLLKWNKNRRKT